ncbi:MAG: protein kinase domain-containing protein, partial [Gaiellaceae bacterium]
MVGEVIAGRYELQDVVDHGGMSNVYLGYDRMLERNVAVKVLHAQYREDDEYVERFRREARAVAQLSHPHIVTVIDRGVSDGHQFIVFEYVQGENLKRLVARTGPMPVRRALDFGIQIADALAFAHAHDIVGGLNENLLYLIGGERIGRARAVVARIRRQHAAVDGVQ